MGHVVVSRLAYAHPGGELLFSDVSFRVSEGRHVGLVGANGVGKSTLFRVLAGALSADEGDVSIGGIVGYMAQDIGVADEDRTVRELLLSLAPLALRSAGERMLRHEAQLAAGDADAGIKLGSAIADWSALGGYELEGQWDAACRRIVRAAFDELADRPAVTLSGGERKQLVLDVLFRSDADRAAARRARQLPRRPGKARARAPDPRIEEDGGDDLPRPRGPVGSGRLDPDAGGQRRLDARRRVPDLSPRARGASTPAGRCGQALAR